MPKAMPAIFYKGRYQRGWTEDCPPDHATAEQNIQFFEKGCGSRYGFDSHLAAQGAWNGIARRVHVYTRVGEATRLIILDNLNQLWDSTSFVAPIYTFAGATTDFAMRSLFNRAYICPHDGNAGVTGEVVYVYDGTTFRAAAGLAPTGFTLTAVEGPAGHIEIGDHLFAVCFETDSGHITAPGFTGTCVVKYTSDDATHKATLAAIPLGPAGTVGRYIVATTILGTTYNGNPAEQEWFFVPDGHIADNTTVTLDVDFYDADLVASADYLQYQLAEIPAGCALVDYRGRLVVIGDPSNASRPWVSNSSEPESFSDIDGFIQIDPGDAGGACKNGVSNRGVLYIMKSQRTYTITDNGAAPSTWIVDRVDSAVGAEANTIGTILNNPGATQDTIFLGDRSGIYMFPSQVNSTEPLTWKIEELWKGINQTYFYKVQIVVDMIDQVIYCNIPYDTATAPDYILIGDFKLGLSKDTIRWSLWSLNDLPSTIWLDVHPTTKKPNLRYGDNTTGTIWKYAPLVRSDHNAAHSINANIKFGPIPEDPKGAVYQLTELRFRMNGSGTFNIAISGMDDTIVHTLTSITLAATPGKEYRRLCNMESEKIQVAVQTYAGVDYFNLLCWRPDIAPVWFDRPR